MLSIHNSGQSAVGRDSHTMYPSHSRSLKRKRTSLGQQQGRSFPNSAGALSFTLSQSTTSAIERVKVFNLSSVAGRQRSQGRHTSIGRSNTRSVTSPHGPFCSTLTIELEPITNIRLFTKVPSVIVFFFL